MNKKNWWCWWCRDRDICR